MSRLNQYILEEPGANSDSLDTSRFNYISLWSGITKNMIQEEAFIPHMHNQRLRLMGSWLEILIDLGGIELYRTVIEPKHIYRERDRFNSDLFNDNKVVSFKNPGTADLVVFGTCNSGDPESAVWGYMAFMDVGSDIHLSNRDINNNTILVLPRLSHHVSMGTGVVFLDY